MSSIKLSFGKPGRKIGDRPADVAGNEAEYRARRGREILDLQFAVQENVAICVLLSRFWRSLLAWSSSADFAVQLDVDCFELFVEGLEFLLGGFQLFIRGLQLLV